MQSTHSLKIQLPRGETSTFDEMQSYGQTLQQFIREQEATLADIQDTQLHNQIVDYLHLLADNYNQQLRVFKETEKRRQRILLLSVMRYADG